jgi:hypothetical protein
MGKQSLSGVGNRDFMPFSVFLYPVHHYEMILVPVDDTGQQCFFSQFVESEAPSHGMEVEFLRRPADAQQRNAVFTSISVIAECFQRVFLPKMKKQFFRQAEPQSMASDW